MRATLALVVALAGCLDPEPARKFEARLTYDGVRSEAGVTFPTYSHSNDQPAVVAGMIVDGDAPIASASLTATDRVSYELDVTRKPDDPDDAHAFIECTVDATEVGHAVACMYSTQACSVVLEEMP